MNMKRTVHLITGKHYDFEKKEYTVGGIQTYINNLLPVIRSMGMDAVVYQFYGDERTELKEDGFRIVNFPVNPDLKDIEKVKIILTECCKAYNDDTDILIFTTDTRIIKTGFKNTIAIQHGIFWDTPVHTDFSPKLSAMYAFSKVRLTYQTARRLEGVKRVVCVDHNFPNWLRASVAYQAIPMTVIPNFAAISPKIIKPKDTVNIIFARRLERYRGTRVFANVAAQVLLKYPQVRVTVAGTGPDLEYMVNKLAEYGDRVKFTSYQAEESLVIHADQHIAVVPTVGSEGTSLSLLEAMSSQCAVVCTSVGGMTNIVLDGYNGLMVSPGNEEELFAALEKLVCNELLCRQLSENAYQTVIGAFSKEKWEEKWRDLLSKEM